MQTILLFVLFQIGSSGVPFAPDVIPGVRPRLDKIATTIEESPNGDQARDVEAKPLPVIVPIADDRKIRAKLKLFSERIDALEASREALSDENEAIFRDSMTTNEELDTLRKHVLQIAQNLTKNDHDRRALVDEVNVAVAAQLANSSYDNIDRIITLVIVAMIGGLAIFMRRAEKVMIEILERVSEKSNDNEVLVLRSSLASSKESEEKNALWYLDQIKLITTASDSVIAELRQELTAAREQSQGGEQGPIFHMPASSVPETTVPAEPHELEGKPSLDSGPFQPHEVEKAVGALAPITPPAPVPDDEAPTPRVERSDVTPNAEFASDPSNNNSGSPS